MFSVITEVYNALKQWQKALLFSFISYGMLLFFIIVAITFILRDFNFLVVAGLTFVYTAGLVIFTLIARRLFSRRLVEE